MKIVIFYYSQTGQAQKVAQNLFSSQREKKGDTTTIIFKEIHPIQTYPFPWSKYIFFDTFPETRLGLPPSGIMPIDFANVKDSDVVVIVGQSWFLSPSLPLQSFFYDDKVKVFLSDRKVIFVNVCRNMWLMTIRWIKKYLDDINCKLIGHIVLQDDSMNLISAATIVRWLIYGRKEGSCLLPTAGVHDEQINNVSRFGNVITNAVKNNDTDNLQLELIKNGAINYKPTIIHLEKVGYRMFGFWAKYIRAKGGFRDIRRKQRVTFFSYYLVFVLFIISPFVQFLLFITFFFHKNNNCKDCNI